MVISGFMLCSWFSLDHIQAVLCSWILHRGYVFSALDSFKLSIYSQSSKYIHKFQLEEDLLINNSVYCVFSNFKHL